MHREVDDIACTLCGCVCDDLTIRTEGERVLGLERGCRLADPWFQSLGMEPSGTSRIRGQQAPLSDAIAEAARLLGTSQAPLIYGLSRSSTPGQQAAVALADWLGATIDTTASTCHAPSIMALQSVGESTCSLGEIRNRSDLIIYWGSNPAESHPRHIERFVDSPGMDIPRGRRDRHLVVVDVVETETSRQADTFLKIHPGSDFDVLTTLRGLVRGFDVPIAQSGGVPVEQWKALAERLKACRYGAVFFGLGLTKQRHPHLNVEALLRLVTDLHRFTRFVARRMRIPGDVTGADSVLCWQTGFPFSVSLSRRYPRFNPGEFTASDLLERREADAVVLVGSEGVHKLSAAAQETLKTLPTMVLDYPGVRAPWVPDVHFTTAIYGVHRRGTAYRMDEVPIPLRAFLPSTLPADHEILQSITEAVRRQWS